MPANKRPLSLDDIALDFHHISASIDLLMDVIGDLSTKEALHIVQKDQISALSAIVRDLAASRCDQLGKLSLTCEIEPKGKAAA